MSSNMYSCGLVAVPTNISLSSSTTALPLVQSSPSVTPVRPTAQFTHPVHVNQHNTEPQFAQISARFSTCCSKPCDITGSDDSRYPRRRLALARTQGTRGNPLRKRRVILQSTHCYVTQPCPCRPRSSVRE